MKRLFLRSSASHYKHGSRTLASMHVLSHDVRNSGFKKAAASGDRNRDAGHWEAGFLAYRSALDIMPLHAGYLTQAGHCLKELHLFLAAEGYYRSALLLGASLADVEEHLIFAAAHSGFPEEPHHLSNLADLVLKNAPAADRLPTFDELCGLVVDLGICDRIHPATLVGFMRGDSDRQTVAANLLDGFGGSPNALSAAGSQHEQPAIDYRRKVLVPPEHAEVLTATVADAATLGQVHGTPTCRESAQPCRSGPGGQWPAHAGTSQKAGFMQRLFPRSAPLANLLDKHGSRTLAANSVQTNGFRNAEFRKHVVAGDKHRDAKRWEEGFIAYRAGLNVMPWHAGYLTQAAHCLKELHLYLAAECYYRSALLLGAPLGDVEAHLIFAADHAGFFQRPEPLARMADTVRNSASVADRIPTFDELCALAVGFGLETRLHPTALIGFLREEAERDTVLAALAGQAGADRKRPAFPDLREPGVVAYMGRVLVATDHPEILATSVAVSGATAAIEAAASNSAAGRPLNAEQQGAGQLRSTLVLADAFVRERHNTAEPMFFGSVPSRADPHNVSQTAEAPAVSVIILNKDNANLTLLSVGAVMAAQATVPYEIIVVDNGSDAADLQALRSAHFPIRIVEVGTNRGFGEGNNIGSELARGQYLLLLNNDAFITPGTIDGLLSAFVSYPDCGAAAPIFRYPDGALQEAGAYVMLDGSTLQRGKGQKNFNPAAMPAFDAADYSSAACLMLLKSEFDAVGGFSPVYGTAYYEDADLCFRLRLRQRSVLIARDCTCFHVENATTMQPMRDGTLVPETSKRAFASVWGDYLLDRSMKNLLPGLLFERPSPVPATQTPKAVAVIDGPMLPRAQERYLLALTGSLNDGATIDISARYPWSQLRLASLLHELQIGKTAGTFVKQDKLSGAHKVMLSETALADTTQKLDDCTVIYTASAVPQGIDPRAAFARLRSAASIVVPSQAARAALDAQMDACQAGRMTARHVPATAPIIELPRPDIRSPWIVSMGPIGERLSDDAHLKLLMAMAAAPEGFRREWTLKLSGPVINAGAAAGTLRQLKEAARDKGVHIDVLFSPPWVRRCDLFARGAVFIQTTGMGTGHPRDYGQCDLFGTDLITALSGGCRTIAWHRGAAPDIFGAAGAGEMYASFEELVEIIKTLDCTPQTGPSAEEVARHFRDTIHS